MNLLSILEPEEMKAQARIRYKGEPWLSESWWLWYGNKLASYLWVSWGKILKSQGISWQDFLKCLSAWKADVKRWLRDELDWHELERDIRDTAPRFKPWLDSRHGRLSKNRFYPLRG